MRAYMMVSRAKGRVLEIDGKKVSQGVFLTKGDSWLTPEVRSFILDHDPKGILDPFAGEGHMLRAASTLLDVPRRGYDIDPAFGWPVNDSLESIPGAQGWVIVTNPPYLAKHSAKRKGVRDRVERYYRFRNDLYQVALDKCIEAADAVVAIVPETIINSCYPKCHMHSVTVLENNPFSDTDCPVCVVCLEKHPHSLGQVSVYRRNKKLASLADIDRARLHPKGDVRIIFNAKYGRVGLRAVDLTQPQDSIRFMIRADCDYPADRIKVSSRLITFVEIPNFPDKQIPQVVSKANDILAAFRSATADLALSPFKGNTTDGKRRRRLDYYSARAILELAARSSTGAESQLEFPLG